MVSWNNCFAFALLQADNKSPGILDSFSPSFVSSACEKRAREGELELELAEFEGGDVSRVGEIIWRRKERFLFVSVFICSAEFALIFVIL